jgi:hypothetical protein
MGFSNILIASRSYPSVRRHLTTGATVASAGILTLGLVVVPPESHGARTESRAVQLATLRLPAQLDALERFIVDQAQTFRHVSEVVTRGAADIPSALLKTPDGRVPNQHTVDSVTDPTIASQSVQAAALAEPIAAVSILDPILGIVSPFLALLNPGVLLLFGPLILLVVLACPPCALFNFVTGIISSFLIDLAPVAAVAAAPIATLEAKATTDTTLTDEPTLSDVSPAADAAGRSADAPPSPKTRKSDEFPAESTQNDQTSTDTAASTQDVTEAAAGAEPSASEDATEPAKPKARPATPRPVVRDSLGSDERRPGLPQRGNGAAKAESASAASSSAASPSTEGNSSGNDSSGGGTDGSD